MGKLFDNAIKFNSGMAVQGGVPLDDRLVVDSIESLYIDAENQEAATLYGVAYTGMVVAVCNEDTTAVYVLKNGDVYKNGKVETVNAANFETYWAPVGGGNTTETVGLYWDDLDLD